MTKFFFLMTVVFSSIFSLFAAESVDHHHTCSYDDDGEFRFIKVYVDGNTFSAHSKYDSKILLPFVQKDKEGYFIPVRIMKKKKSDDDEEEEYWDCPMCGQMNPPSADFCTNPDCVLYRNGWRTWAY